MRRAMRASLSPFATLRSTRGLRSRRIVNADILPSIESMAAANHEPRADGIPQRQHESGVSTIGMTHLYRPVLLLGCQFGLREPGQLLIRLGDGEQGVLVGTIAQLIRAATRVLSALSPMRWVVRPRCWRSDQAQDPAHNEA